MGSIHQSAEKNNVICLQRRNRFYGTLIFRNRMSGTSDADLTGNVLLRFLKLLFGQIAEGFNVHMIPDVRQRFFALASSFVILGVTQTALLVGAGNDNFGILKCNRRIFIG